MSCKGYGTQKDIRGRGAARMLRSVCLAVLVCAFVSLLPGQAKAEDFRTVMQSHKDEIITQCREYGIWPSAVVGMAGVESGYPAVSVLAGTYNNYWGLSVSATVSAIVPCGDVYEGFAAYPTFSDGLHAYLIWFWQGCYPGVAGVLRNLKSKPADMYSAVVTSGYMEGTEGYYEGITAAVHAAGAEDWDALAFPNGRKYIPYVEGMPDSRQVGSYDYPADRYNPHVQIDRLLPENSVGSDEKISYDQLLAERDAGEVTVKKLQTEQRREPSEEKQEEKRAENMEESGTEDARLSAAMQ